MVLAEQVTRDTPLIQAESSSYIKTTFEYRQDSTENEHACSSGRRCLHRLRCIPCIDKISAQILHVDV